MRYCVGLSSAIVLAAFAAISLVESVASAQDAAPPPPGYAPPPPGYAPPPPGYAPPPAGYAAPPPAGYGYGVPGQPYAVQPQPPAGPKTMDYEDGEPIPAGYHKKTRVRKGMVAGGAATFGALYIFSLLIGAAGDSVCSSEQSSGTTVNPCRPNGWRDLYIPVAGPFVAIAGLNATGGTAPLLIDGIGQAAGLALLIVGIAMPTTELVRDDVGKPKFFVTPTVARGATGLGVVGTF